MRAEEVAKAERPLTLRQPWVGGLVSMAGRVALSGAARAQRPFIHLFEAAVRVKLEQILSREMPIPSGSRCISVWPW